MSLLAILLGVVGTIILIFRLFLLRREALVVGAGLGAMFLIGFGGSFFDHTWRWTLMAMGLALVIGTIFAVGRLPARKQDAALAIPLRTPGRGAGQ